jgi:hypothetical protein
MIQRRKPLKRAAWKSHGSALIASSGSASLRDCIARVMAGTIWELRVPMEVPLQEENTNGQGYRAGCASVKLYARGHDARASTRSSRRNGATIYLVQVAPAHGATGRDRLGELERGRPHQNRLEPAVALLVDADQDDSEGLTQGTFQGFEDIDTETVSAIYDLTGAWANGEIQFTLQRLHGNVVYSATFHENFPNRLTFHSPGEVIVLVN